MWVPGQISESGTKVSSSQLQHGNGRLPQIYTLTRTSERRFRPFPRGSFSAGITYKKQTWVLIFLFLIFPRMIGTQGQWLADLRNQRSKDEEESWTLESHWEGIQKWQYSQLFRKTVKMWARHLANSVLLDKFFIFSTLKNTYL